MATKNKEDKNFERYRLDEKKPDRKLLKCAEEEEKSTILAPHQKYKLYDQESAARTYQKPKGSSSEHREIQSVENTTRPSEHKTSAPVPVGLKAFSRSSSPRKPKRNKKDPSRAMTDSPRMFVKGSGNTTENAESVGTGFVSGGPIKMHHFKRFGKTKLNPSTITTTPSEQELVASNRLDAFAEDTSTAPEPSPTARTPHYFRKHREGSIDAGITAKSAADEALEIFDLDLLSPSPPEKKMIEFERAIEKKEKNRAKRNRAFSKGETAEGPVISLPDTGQNVTKESCVKKNENNASTDDSSESNSGLKIIKKFFDSAESSDNAKHPPLRYGRGSDQLFLDCGTPDYTLSDFSKNGKSAPETIDYYALVSLSIKGIVSRASEKVTPSLLYENLIKGVHLNKQAGKSLNPVRRKSVAHKCRAVFEDKDTAYLVSGLYLFYELHRIDSVNLTMCFSDLDDSLVFLKPSPAFDILVFFGFNDYEPHNLWNLKEKDVRRFKKSAFPVRIIPVFVDQYRKTRKISPFVIRFSTKDKPIKHFESFTKEHGHHFSLFDDPAVAVVKDYQNFRMEGVSPSNAREIAHLWGFRSQFVYL
jgi:hypothetical protein